ncbi:MAG: family 16 glycosylhydrolase [Polyangiaceae bacterium]
MTHRRLSLASLLFGTTALCTAWPGTAGAVSSAELYTAPLTYGRFEARVQYAAGDGVVSSFFLWKPGSEKAGTYWNELDFEKLGADCHVETNAYYGLPAQVHGQKPTLSGDLCGDFHTYAYEWTPDYIAWFVDDAEIRRETGAAATAYSDNAAGGMEIHFNIWPGDATFGGNFSPSILPVEQHIDWVQYSSYADGAFTLEWREDFDGDALPTGWLTGNWGSPKNLSTHKPANVTFVNGEAVLLLSADASSSGGSAGTGGASNAGMAGTTGGASPSSPRGGGCQLSTPASSAASGPFSLLLLGALWRRQRRVRRSLRRAET